MNVLILVIPKIAKLSLVENQKKTYAVIIKLGFTHNVIVYILIHLYICKIRGLI